MNKTIFKNWKLYEILWVTVATLSTLGLSLYWGDSPLAIVSSLTGILSVILVAKRMSLNYLFGAINVSTYAILSYQASFYGEVMLNALYYLPMQFIGLYMWKKAKEENDGEIESKSLSTEGRIRLVGISVSLVIFYGFFLKSLGNYLPFLDSTSTILSIIAMILMVKQFMEQWVIWVIINVVSIIMWAFSLINGVGEMATLIMWIVYLCNSIFGLYSWKKAQIKEVK
jgi:nicotinamide mononucleotide transporter